MTRHVLVIGHADADGHLIAEQARRNLALVDSFDVHVVVDPTRTRDHKVWMHLDAFDEIASADYVFFVDLMFGPGTYIEEAEALTSFAQDHPDKRFFLVDHHPLPLRRLESADNLRVIYRPEVLECTFGPRSGMMVVAALCEKQIKDVADIKSPVHDLLAVGVKRAAALGGPLPGEKLLTLLRDNRWDALLRLGSDDPKHHYLPRGRRPSGQLRSDALQELDRVAISLMAHPDNGNKSSNKTQGKTTMAYDIDVGEQQLSYDTGQRTLQRNTTASPKDLGVIVTLLEVAALSLTTGPGATFTFDQLVREARKIGGKDVNLEERDIRIVLQKATFVKKVGSEYRLK